jgi:hypothetical protein
LACELKMDRKIRHPADGRQWKHFDLAHQEDFSNELRNLRFGLSMDGMNPFREMRKSHNTWLVNMCIFNLPSWLCHIKVSFIDNPHIRS